MRAIVGASRARQVRLLYDILGEGTFIAVAQKL